MSRTRGSRTRREPTPPIARRRPLPPPCRVDARLLPRDLFFHEFTEQLRPPRAEREVRVAADGVNGGGVEIDDDHFVGNPLVLCRRDHLAVRIEDKRSAGMMRLGWAFAWIAIDVTGSSGLIGDDTKARVLAAAG